MPEEAKTPDQTGVQIGAAGMRMVDRILNYQRELLIGGAAIFVVILLYALVSYIQGRADEKAWAGIFTAMYKSQENKAAMPAALESAIKENPGARAVFYAQMLRSGMLGTETAAASIAAAADACAQFLNDFPSHPFAGQMHVDYGTLLANQGKLAEARAQYAEVIKNGPAYLEGEALLFSALCFEKEGKVAEALEGYRKVSKSGNPLYLGDVVEYAAFAESVLMQKQLGAGVKVEPAAPAAATPAAAPAAVAPTKADEPKPAEAAPAPAAPVTPATK